MFLATTAFAKDIRGNVLWHPPLTQNNTVLFDLSSLICLIHMFDAHVLKAAIKLCFATQVYFELFFKLRHCTVTNEA